MNELHVEMVIKHNLSSKLETWLCPLWATTVQVENEIENWADKIWTFQNLSTAF